MASKQPPSLLPQGSKAVQTAREPLNNSLGIVTPAKAGAQRRGSSMACKSLASGFRRNDELFRASLGDENLSFEFLGYAAQNLVYFATPEEGVADHLISQTKRYATQLGYWLFNYILMFPGPILTRKGAAAFLNVVPDQVCQCEAFTQVLEDARYRGPFSDVEPYYWRTKLVDLADGAGGEIVKHESLQAARLTRVDQDPHAVQAFICMISGEAITQDQAAPNPDWVPSGASILPDTAEAAETFPEFVQSRGN